MGREIRVKAPAKINIGLTVHNRRADGFHEIESVMQQVSLADTLLMEEWPVPGLLLRCNVPGLVSEDNLVCKAANILEREAGFKLPGVRISLYKNIPEAAGLAGGSSDAAAALRGLNKLWGLQLDNRALLKLGAELGSDVPFCLTGGTALARGRGEILEPLPQLPFFWVVLALPQGVKIATADAYRLFNRELLGKPSLDDLITAVRSSYGKGIESWMAGDFVNTLETAVLPGTEAIIKMKQHLKSYGFKPALSGSGPTLFMLIANYRDACLAARLVDSGGGRGYLCWTEAQDKEW
jgi:4-diphosphocytidyl-2-C-methyl-D-erythritol kinase